MEIKPVGLYDATQEVETLYAALLDTQAELSRLRAENERLRKVADLARMYRELGQQIINGGVWGFDEDVRDKYLHTRHVLDRALAALDQDGG